MFVGDGRLAKYIWITYKKKRGEIGDGSVVALPAFLGDGIGENIVDHGAMFSFIFFFLLFWYGLVYLVALLPWECLLQMEEGSLGPDDGKELCVVWVGIGLFWC